VVCVNCVDEPTTLLNDAFVAAQWATQLSQMANTVSNLEQQLTQQIAIYKSLTNLTNVQQIATILQQPGNFNSMQSFGNVPAMIQGGGGEGSLAGAIASLQQSNAYYMPQAGAPSGMPLLDATIGSFNARSNSNAAVQAVSQQLLANSNTQLAGLKNIQDQLDASPDEKTATALNGRLAAYQANVAAQRSQLQQVALYAHTQEAVFQEQDRQAVFCADVAYYNSRKSLSGTGITIPGASGATCGSGPGQGGGAGVVAANGSGGVVPASLTTTGSTSSGQGGLMMAQPWGSDAAANANALGVNPDALAATCAIESNCQNVAGQGSVSGPFQMTDNTFNADLAKAQAQNPDLNVAGGKSDPAVQAIAASQDLKSTALTLSSAGIADPTVLDTRGAYQFGAGNAVTLAKATDDQTLGSVLVGTSPQTLAANNLSPGTTVGQWRQSVVAKLGGAANTPVLLGAGA
jgi:flagellar biosynthesis chaperone FliJ